MFKFEHIITPKTEMSRVLLDATMNIGFAGFAREITLIDYGVTSDPEQFVTEIIIPVSSGDEM